MPRAFSGIQLSGDSRFAFANDARKACELISSALAASNPEVRGKADELLRCVINGRDVAASLRTCNLAELLVGSVEVVLQWIAVLQRMGDGGSSFVEDFVDGLRKGELAQYLSQAEAPARDPFSNVNEHRLYDPRWAEHDAIRAYSAATQVLERSIKYAADILLDSFQASPSSAGSTVAIACLFRQVIAAADGVLLHLRHGASYIARLPARSALEGSLQLEFVLRGDTDRLGLQYYAASQRRLRAFMIRMREGTLPHEHRDRVFRSEYRMASPIADATVDDIDRQIASLDQSLRGEGLAAIDLAFERARGIRDREPEWWFSVGGNTDQSLAGIARKLGRSAEYELYYETLSDAVHGRAFERHVHQSPAGEAPEFIRHSGDTAPVLQMTIHWLTKAVQLVTDAYLPERSAEVELWVRETRSQLVLPNIRQVDESPVQSP